jgi:hypothetical protein
LVLIDQKQLKIKNDDLQIKKLILNSNESIGNWEREKIDRELIKN